MWERRHPAILLASQQHIARYWTFHAREEAPVHRKISDAHAFLGAIPEQRRRYHHAPETHDARKHMDRQSGALVALYFHITTFAPSVLSQAPSVVTYKVLSCRRNA